MKGFVTIFELVLVILILIGTFAIFFPRVAYETRWEEALLLLKGRDAILTADRIGKLYEYSFNFSALSNFLNEKAFPGEVLIYLPAIEGTIKSTIHAACNCTDEEKKIITDWLKGPRGLALLRVNGRDVDFDVCTTHLEALNPCLSKDADVLIIWGRKNLSSNHSNLLKGHLERGNGIVEIRDFYGLEDMDIVQQEIFGLSWTPLTGTPNFDKFPRKPTSVTDIIYGPWKYFYHIPINLENTTFESIAGCTFQPSAKGNFTFKQVPYTFWICDSTSIWLDENRNGVREVDERIYVGNNFRIAGYNFYLSYIRNNVAIGISFKPEYNFTDSDFLRVGVGGIAYNVQPGDGNKNRILLNATPEGFPAVILNITPISRVAWVANFTEGGTDDDERLLFVSLLLWVSNQGTFWLRDGGTIPEYLKVAYSTSYVNTVNIDMFEVYKFKLGVGYPYR